MVSCRRYGCALRRRRVRGPARRGQGLGGGREHRRTHPQRPGGCSTTSAGSWSIRAPASVSAWPGAGSESTDAEELLRNADVAMYMAKRERKGSYRVFEPAMHERVRRAPRAPGGVAARARARSARTSLPAGRSTREGCRLRRRGAAPLDRIRRAERSSHLTSSPSPRRPISSSRSAAGSSREACRAGRSPA